MAKSEKQAEYREKEKIKRGVKGFIGRLRKMPEHEVSAYITAVLQWRYGGKGGIEIKKTWAEWLDDYFSESIKADRESEEQFQERVRVNQPLIDALLKESKDSKERAEEDKNPDFIRPINPKSP